MPDKQRQINELRATLSKMEIALGKVEECIVWTDVSGRIKWCNEAFNQFLGQPKLMILGQYLYNKLPLLLEGQAIAPADHPVNLALRTKQHNKQSYEFQQNGELRFIEITWAFVEVKANLELQTPEESSAVIVARDITQQCLFEQQLQTANEQLEQLVIQRTEELQAANLKLELEANQLQFALEELQRAQMQLIQSEKMSALGQLVAGIAHEINNPINFIHGNLFHLEEGIETILTILDLYQQQYPTTSPIIEQTATELELDFILEDIPKLLQSMRLGSNRIREIVLSLRNFSRMDEAEYKAVNLQEGIESTLLILRHRLREMENQFNIEVQCDYDEHVPLVECYAGQLNQVFMNILVNGIDALQERYQAEKKIGVGRITIQLHCLGTDWVEIRIADNGTGMSETVQQHLFDPFFTTKEIGKGTGMGMAISYQIITEKHRGRLFCSSVLGEGTEFVIHIPIRQPVV